MLVFFRKSISTRKAWKIKDYIFYGCSAARSDESTKKNEHSNKQIMSRPKCYSVSKVEKQVY